MTTPKPGRNLGTSTRGPRPLWQVGGRTVAGGFAASALVLALLPGNATAGTARSTAAAAGVALAGQSATAISANVDAAKAKSISKTVKVGRAAARIKLLGATLIIRRGTFPTGTRVTLTLGAKAPRGPYGVRPYTTSINVRASGGRQPRKAVHLLLPYKAALPAGLKKANAIRPATYHPKAKKWTPVPFKLASRGRIDVTLKHFSWKDLFTFDWNGLYDAFKQAAGLYHVNPHCSPGSTAPAWLNVDATPYGVDTCVRSEGNRAYLEFANNHPYGVIISFGGINPRPTPWTDWGINDANTRAILSRIAPYLFGDSELYVGPWGAASLGINPGTWNYTALSVRPTGTTWAIDALRLLLPYTPGLRDVAGKADTARELANSLWTCTKPVSDGIKNGNPASIATGFQCLARKFAESKINQFEQWLLKSVAALIGLANAIGSSISLIANTLAGQASASIGLTNKTPSGGTPPPAAPAGSSSGWHVVGASGGLGFHTQPNSSSPTTRVLPNGSAVAIVCQIAGASVTFAGRPSIVWNKTAQGDYATDVYFDTPVAWNFSPQFPRCEDYTPPTTPPTPSTGGAAAITVNTCNTYGNCTTFNPIYVHSSPTVSSRIADAPNGLGLTARCWTSGRTLTDGSNNTTEDDARQFTSDLWFGVDWSGGRGYVPAVWTTKSSSHLNLPDCNGVVPPPVSSATITVNTCNTYNDCATFNPIYVHSNPAVSSRIGDAYNTQQLTARCWTGGRTLTDGSNNTSEDDARQFTSSLWFGVDWNGGRGYVPAVWTTKSESHLGLPGC